MYVLSGTNSEDWSCYHLGRLWRNHEVAQNFSVFLQLVHQPFKSFIEVSSLLILARGGHDSILCVLNLGSEQQLAALAWAETFRIDATIHSGKRYFSI